MTHFTPVSAVLGGALIGLSAALLWLGLGRIAGISGIVGSLVGGSQTRLRGEIAWRLAFLAGLVAAPPLYALATGSGPAIRVTSDPALLIAAGLLVGFGTRLGGGCTSGHGVCGLARLSRRSVVATALFIGAAVMAVFLTHHTFGS
jgi:uncharacterized membrane protein YedE/YeeE